MDKQEGKPQPQQTTQADTLGDIEGLKNTDAAKYFRGLINLASRGRSAKVVKSETKN